MIARIASVFRVRVATVVAFVMTTVSAIAFAAAAPLPVPLGPRTPAIVAIPGGHLSPHTDYVRLTYAMPAGESPPSAEVPDSVGPSVLTKVESPAAASGAIGYNVYAVSNNGDSNAGHLQNDVPISFGSAYIEPESGWRTTGRALSTDPHEPVVTVEILSAGGTSIAIPQIPSIGGNVIFPSTPDAAVVTISTIPATPLRGDAGGMAFTFDRTTHFRALPTFYFRSETVDSEQPAEVEVRDATEHRTLGILDKGELGPLSFWGRPWTQVSVAPFVAIGGHRYEARLLPNPSSMLKIDSSAKQDFALPPVAGIDIDVHVPPPSNGSSDLIVRTASAPPNGVPVLADASVRRVLFFVTVISRVVANYDGDLTATIRMPATAPHDRDYAVAAYDAGLWYTGWNYGIARSTLRGNVLSFDVNIADRKLFPRTYVLAVYATAPAGGHAIASAATPHVAARPQLVIVGDSVNVLTTIQPAATGCPVTFASSPTCQYVVEPGSDFASLAARSASYDAINLSHVGTLLVGDTDNAEGAATLEIPQIPLTASVVVVTAGTQDIGTSPHADHADHLDVAVNAIRAFAPHARIVFVGPRYFNDTETTPLRAFIDAWDDRARSLGQRYGAFLDLRTVVPAGYTALTPDGAHYTVAAQSLIASALAKVLLTLRPR